MSFFKSIALPLAARGIPVIPVKGKQPFLSGFPKLAITNPAHIDDWDTQYPDCNVGCVALWKKAATGIWTKSPNLISLIELIGAQFPTH